MKKILLTIALLASACAMNGCAWVSLSDPGAIEGLAFAGRPGVCGPQDRAVYMRTVSVQFIRWNLFSGSLAWDSKKGTIKGSPSFVDYTTQDHFMQAIENLAEYYDADITQYEIDDVETFNVGDFTGLINAPYMAFEWLFPTREMACSAILRPRTLEVKPELGVPNE